jgi:DNA-binding CsgD family transcriptional regulator
VLADFSGLRHEDDIWHMMQDTVAREFGVTDMMIAFTHSVYAATRVGLTNSLIIRHSVAQDYLDLQKGRLDLDHDAVVRAALHGAERIMWADVDDEAMPEEDRERHELDKRMGFGVGVSFGIRFGSGGAACICLGARHADAREFDAALSRHELTLASLVRDFERAMRSTMIARRLHLTAREREVLAYSAAGLTAKQIAGEIGLSVKTVRNTLERARHSLDAASMPEAVAKSLVFDLVG